MVERSNGNHSRPPLKVRQVSLDTGRDIVVVISRHSSALRPEIFRGFSRVELQRGTKVLLATLLITDDEGPVGLAGIMGGNRTAVGSETTEVFLEVAYFPPEAIIGRPRRWGLLTDASQRYERGVDPTLQVRAIERAIGLLCSIAGGETGPVMVTESVGHQPQRHPVPLRRTQLERLLGLELAPGNVTGTLEALQMKVAPTAQGWEVTPPPYRFDIAIEADLIEEVARIVGYEAIPELDALGPQRFRKLPEERPLEHVRSGRRSEVRADS